MGMKINNWRRCHRATDNWKPTIETQATGNAAANLGLTLGEDFYQSHISI